MDVRCSFSVRIPVDGGFRYEHVALHVWDGSTSLPTDHPPFVGDLIHLWGQTDETRGAFKVVERAWTHASFGSHDWPYSESRPTVSPLLDIIVEPASGPFRDEVASDDTEGE